MRGSAKLAVVLLAAAPLLQACSMFGGDASPPRRYASQGNPDCARLRPLVTNADGSLPRADMETSLTLAYKKYDVDVSGQLSMSEVAPANDALRAQNVNASPVMDWNGDGRVNFQEFAGGWRTMFDLFAHGGGDVVTQNDMERSPMLLHARANSRARASPDPARTPRTGRTAGRANGSQHCTQSNGDARSAAPFSFRTSRNCGTSGFIGQSLPGTK